MEPELPPPTHHTLYKYTADVCVSYYTYASYEIGAVKIQMYHILLSAPACWVAFVSAYVQCMYLRTTLCMYAYTCAYACVVCMSATRYHMPLPSSPHPVLPSFPLYTNKCIIHIDTYRTPHADAVQCVARLLHIVCLLVPVIIQSRGTPPLLPSETSQSP